MQKGRIKTKGQALSNVVFFLSALCISIVSEGSVARAPVTVNVGVITVDASADLGKIMLSSINVSLTDLYDKNGNYCTRLLLNVRSTQRDVVAAAAEVIDLIKYNQVQAIIGPPTSMEANFVKALGEKAQVPILSVSATDPSLTSVRKPYFFRATQNDSTQTGAISALMEAFGWREAVPIYVDNEFGQGILPYLAEALEDVHASIPYRCPISADASEDQIHAALSDLIKFSARVFIVHMEILLGQKIFSMASRLGMMSEGYVWIMTDSLTHSFNSSAIHWMQGALGVRPHINRGKKLQNFEARWKAKFRKDNPESEVQKLNIYALWASDAAVALAKAVEQTGVQYFGHKSTNFSAYPNDIKNIPVSVNGPNLLEALGQVKFSGLTGNFQFVDGQLPPATYQIINIYGNSYKGIGFWTPGKGLSKKLINPTENSIPSANLSPIMWPGDSIKIPKGWEIPTIGKKLKIAVPVKVGISPFVSVTKDETGEKFSGFSIDIFEEVVKALPYPLRFEYSLFSLPNGSSAGSYNEMIYQVRPGLYDAAVGDITVVADRAKYVDFTMPYTESGVSVVVRSSYGKATNPWIFMKPLSKELWITSFCSFIGIGFVVWYLEHRANTSFQGRPLQQLGNSLWFSFSTMFFSQSENVVSNATKIVVIVWCFVVLILTQSYTASLASLLTVQQLQPVTVTIKDLIARKVPVGYPNGSFVEDKLKQLGFEESLMVSYLNLDECHQLFENETIEAAVDEMPYLRPFFANYCGLYTAKHAFETGGFGFVFQTGSPLAADVSRAVLKVVTTVYNTTKVGSVSRLADKWLSPAGSCLDEKTMLTSSRLELKSFSALFIIVLVISVAALMAAFVVDRRNERAVRPLEIEEQMGDGDGDGEGMERAPEMEIMLGPLRTQDPNLLTRRARTM